MKKHKNAGWYHFASLDGFGGIEYMPEGIKTTWGRFEYRQQAYGPFKTFGHAQRDAIKYYQTDINTAREHIHRVRKTKKCNSFYRGEEQE